MQRALLLVRPVSVPTVDPVQPLVPMVVPYETMTMIFPVLKPQLSDDDVDRIARRVAEILRDAKATV